MSPERFVKGESERTSHRARLSTKSKPSPGPLSLGGRPPQRLIDLLD
jgi:hypothetical protein